MSKGKKTIEVLLEEALIPEEEQQYEAPDNWVWIRLKDGLSSIQYGYTETSTLQEIGPKFLRITDIQNDDVDWNSVPFCKINEHEKEKYKLEDNDLVVARTGATTGKSYLINNPPMSVFASYLIRLRCNSSMLPTYLWEYMKSPMYWRQIMVVKKGSAQPGANAQILGNLSVPLPPLQEQKRIAEKVESLLDKIEEAKQLIEEVKETFELRRTAILDRAFHGELTQNWRIQNLTKLDNFVVDKEIKGYFEVPKGWKWTELKNVVNFKSGYAFKSKDFVEQGIQLIRMGNLYKNELALDRNPVFLPFDYDEKILEKYTVNNGDILLSLTGTKYKRDYGYAVRLEGIDRPLLLNQRILSINPNFMDEYIFYYLQSSTFRDVFFSFETGGVNQGNVGSKAVESILIPIPPKEEVKEIEKKLNGLVKGEKESLKILNVDEKLETLKQSILTQAFRGELGTNDPSEENAIELLKEALQEQVM